MSLVGYAEQYAITPRTSRANGLLKEAGAQLKMLSAENDSLHTSLHEERQKVSSLQRETDLMNLALDAVESGLIRPAQVRAKVSSWKSETHPVEYYKALLRASMNPAFASVEGGVDVSKQSSVDRGNSNSDTGDGLSPSARAATEQLQAILRQL